jgi:hypothetical protein
MARPRKKKPVVLPPANSVALDRDGFHRYLWNEGGRKHRVMFTYAELAEKMGCNYYTVAKLVADFMKEGRLSLIARPKTSGSIYLVADPEDFGA